MPWQRLVADVGLEIDPDTGVFAYREVWVSVPRQSGKTTLVLAWEVDRCVSWGEPQRVAYTAQTGSSARRKLLEDQVPIVERSSLGTLIRPPRGKVYHSLATPAMVFGGGSRIDVNPTSEASGHGQTIDLAVIDEAWKDEDDRREQAMLPAMRTRPMAQLLGCSTMGTDASVYLNRKVEIGRAAAVEDPGSGIAYFEWSVPEEEDIADPEVWWRYMPALGWTVPQSAVEHEIRTMDVDEFRRASCNQRTGAKKRLIPADLWDAVQDPSAVPEGEPQWGLDVIRNIDGHADAGAIVAASDGKAALVDARPGTGWIVERVVELHRRRGGRVVIDGGGPAAPIADDLEDAGVPVVRLPGGMAVSACGRLYDAIADGKVRVYPSQEMDESAAGLAKKPVGDRFVFSRKVSSSDATPFLALAWAFSRAEAVEEVSPWASFG